MTTPSSPEAGSDQVATLRVVRQKLVALHKALLDRERTEYERDHGRIETTQQHLQMLMEHPSFAWLRPMSGLIVRFDERLAKTQSLLAVDARQLAIDARALTTVGDELTEYQRRYHRAVDSSPGILSAHAEVARSLGPLLGAPQRKPVSDKG